MPSWLTKRNLELAAGCAGLVAVLLSPASLITLGLGAVLGYRGRDCLNQLLEEAEEKGVGVTDVILSALSTLNMEQGRAAK